MSDIVKVIIERVEDDYIARLDGIDGITVSGSTISGIKQGITEAIASFKKECIINRVEIPEKIRGEDYNFIYKMEVESLLKFYYGIFSKAGLERITGINQKQLWHYASGGRKPRRAQVIKLEEAIHKLGEELISITL